MSRFTGNRARLLLVVAVLLIGSACGLLGQDLWLAAKAEVAGCLLDRSLAAHLADGRPHPPWSWADFAPVACLEVPRLGIYRHVLTGATGESMAFGLGHLDGSAPPNGRGNCVLTGHRDSWCAFLRSLRQQDLVILRTRDGSGVYLVEHTDVVHREDLAPVAPAADTRLTLITCYPFSGLRAGQQRFVVRCRPIVIRKQNGYAANARQVYHVM